MRDRHVAKANKGRTSDINVVRWREQLLTKELVLSRSGMTKPARERGEAERDEGLPLSFH